jgi:hypothetical protein
LPILIQLLTWSRATIEWKPFKDGKMDFIVYMFVTNLILSRLTKAEGIYEENGCSSLKGHSKGFLLHFIIHTDFAVPGFRSAYGSMAHGLLR